MTSGNYRNFGDPRALYWAEYRRTHEAFTNLKPGEKVPDHVLINFIAGYNFLPTHFDLRKKDREPFSGVNYPSKSAHIAFSYDIKTIYGAILDRESRGRRISRICNS